MHMLSLILWPISYVMRLVLETAHAVTGDYGVSIILLGATVRAVTTPIAKIASGAEQRNHDRLAAMEAELAEIRAKFKGRERFERIEGVYRRHKYHPIHSVSAMLPLFLQIPFLLAALFLLSDYAPLAGQRFLMIPDLLQPDRLLSLGAGTKNMLPLLICAVALTESLIKPNSNRSARVRFLIVTAVIVVLIYRAPAGVCLYWLTGNTLSLGRALWARRPVRK